METTLTPELPKKASFADTYAHSGLSYGNIDMMAEKAGVPRDEPMKMLVGQPITRSHTTRILAAFNELTGQKWTLNALDIKVLDEER